MTRKQTFVAIDAEGCCADYPTSQAANVNSEPTFVVINFSGNLRCMAAIKFDPEQCIGKTTSGSITSSSSIVCSM